MNEEVTDPNDIPTEPEGTPTEPEGTPTEPEGTPTEPEGTPTEPEGTPTEPEGTPTEPVEEPVVTDPITKLYVDVEGVWVEGTPVAGEPYKEEVTYPDGRVNFIVKSAPLPEVTTKLTRLAFKIRMTSAERIAIRNAAEINDDVYDFMDLLSEATFVDLTDPSTIGSINALASIGLLETSRATTILTDPIMEHEKYVAP